jgi:uncharacterized damage-inducible protein DinB
MNYVRELIKYTLWADRTVVNALAGVGEEDLVRPTGASFDSVLGTMAHILGSERMWLSRFIGNPLPALPGIADYPDHATLRAGFDELRFEMEMFMAGLSDEQLQAELTWTNRQGDTFTRPLWQPVLHLCNHSTYHRGQLASMLRQLGYQPVGTDLIYFLIDRDPH